MNQQYPWATGQVTLEYEQSEPLKYHRLLRGLPRYQAWYPVVTIFGGNALYIAFAIVVAVIIGAFVGVALGPQLLAEDGVSFNFDTETFDPEQMLKSLRDSMLLPLGLALLLLSVILMLPAAQLAMRFLGKGAFGRIWSVQLRIRWGLLAAFSGAAMLLYLLTQGGFLAIGLILGLPETQDFSPPPNMAVFVVSLLVVLLLVPLQATAEEVVFRGILLQGIGAWLRSPVWAVLISSVIFGVMHLQYNPMGMFVVGIMGVACAIVTIRTGGLEAAMALHIVNNLFAFGIGLFGLMDSEVTVVSFFMQLLLCGLFLLLVEIIWRLKQRPNQRVDWVLVAKPVLAPVAQPGAPVAVAPAATTQADSVAPAATAQATDNNTTPGA